ncbi:MAG: HAMP domain-containing sensor histidine kinase [Magnetospirillum sp.]|nr:HAMP domain-containing sensor histidine kinase [Magnetospirillum sp.]
MPVIEAVEKIFGKWVGVIDWAGNRVIHYVVAVVLVLVAIALRMALAPQTGGIPFVTFFPMIALAALIGGFGPGMLVTIAGAGASLLWFYPPRVYTNAYSAMAIYVVGETIVCLAIDAMHRYYRDYVRTSRELERARRAAEQANEAKSRFLAAASHDLRQPYQALRLYQTVLQGKVTDPATAAIVRQMDVAMSAGETLLQSLLDISTLEAGVTIPKPQATDVAELFSAIESRHRPFAEAKGLRLNLRTNVPSVVVDPVLLARILDNLVANAIRYTDLGRVLVTCRMRGGRPLFQVWDTGIGIAPEYQEAVFDEFFQVANVERDSAKGAGLGLAVVRKTASLLGAKLSLRSRPNRGTVVSALLPESARA